MYKIWLFVICFGAFWSQDSLAGLNHINIPNKPSLQRGAKVFMNYCSGCHSLKYMRYNRMAEDLGLMGFDGRIDEDLLKNNLIFTQAVVNDPIRIALPPEDAKQWFGVVPPDLSLVAREKGIDWLSLYLTSFYNDNSRPFGTNNLLVPGVAMPNVFAGLLGEMVLDPGDNLSSMHLALVKKGTLSATQFNGLVQDLVTFLAYVSEPEYVIRQQIGVFVIMFLFVFLLVVIALQKLYWRKIQ
jgi:ubiquinol-cytochrome c reductase cytochrome c1 subunit